MDGSARPAGNQIEQPLHRRRLLVKGIVQGVGFRPHVYTLAVRLGLAGLVGNDGGGVFIEIEGPAAALDRFAEDLRAQPPPLATIERIEAESLAVRGDSAFVIVPSSGGMSQRTLVAPDQALCADCRRELLDPTDRRYLYPFINCTNCGPRYTIIYATPYDRPATTMAGFRMCADCRRQYEDPADRRFHAQPIACPQCGPQLAWRVGGAEACGLPATADSTVDLTADLTADSSTSQTLKAVHHALRVLAAGGTVAIKGVGGYHLACVATDAAAVTQLRLRKGRADKPLAVMAADLETARRYAWIDDDEAALLTGRARPIVLLRKRDGADLAPQVAPGNSSIGIMLPYTPLHELLFHMPGTDAAPLLVMTSGNLSEEPIVWRDDEALSLLAPLVDGFLLHDRPIHVACDDSVMRLQQGQPLPIRRGRGYAPMPLALALGGPPLLAVGADLKASFCLAQDGHAILSQHIGDMGNLSTYTAFGRAVTHLESLFRIEPEVIARDAHPGYLSTRWAQEYAGERPVVAVQHHHAHIASLVAEQLAAGNPAALPGNAPIIGFSWDGTGYGTDGAIWGGETLIVTFGGFERRAHLRYTPMPGGDAAVQRPYRTALAHLWAAGMEWAASLPPVAACPPFEQALLRRQLESGLHCVPSSSMGRLFDAVAALLGVRQMVTYEGQAAIELESLLPAGIGLRLRDYDRPGCAFAVTDQDGVLLCDPGPLVRWVAAGVLAGMPAQELAAAFHAALVQLIVQVSCTLRAQTGIMHVGLSGGVFQNVPLLTGAAAALADHGFRVLVHRAVPANDGGVALGQAAIAAARIS